MKPMAGPVVAFVVVVVVVGGGGVDSVSSC